MINEISVFLSLLEKMFYEDATMKEFNYLRIIFPIKRFVLLLSFFLFAVRMPFFCELILYLYFFHPIWVLTSVCLLWCSTWVMMSSLAIRKKWLSRKRDNYRSSPNHSTGWVSWCSTWMGFSWCSTWMGILIFYLDGYPDVLPGWLCRCSTWMGVLILYLDGYPYVLPGWVS